MLAKCTKMLAQCTFLYIRISVFKKEGRRSKMYINNLHFYTYISISHICTAGVVRLH